MTVSFSQCQCALGCAVNKSRHAPPSSDLMDSLQKVVERGGMINFESWMATQCPLVSILSFRSIYLDIS